MRRFLGGGHEAAPETSAGIEKPADAGAGAGAGVEEAPHAGASFEASSIWIASSSEFG